MFNLSDMSITSSMDLPKASMTARMDPADAPDISCTSLRRSSIVLRWPSMA